MYFSFVNFAQTGLVQPGEMAILHSSPSREPSQLFLGDHGSTTMDENVVEVNIVSELYRCEYVCVSDACRKT